MELLTVYFPITSSLLGPDEVKKYQVLYRFLEISHVICRFCELSRIFEKKYRKKEE